MMICAMFAQTLLGARAFPALASENDKINISGYATPSEAFEYFDMWTDSKTVTSDGFKLHLGLAFDDTFLQNALNETNDEIDNCPDFSFNLKVKCDGLKENMVFQPQNLTTTKGEIVGTLSADNRGGYLDISINFDDYKESIYSNEDIAAGTSLAFVLESGHNGDNIEIDDNKKGVVTIKLSTNTPVEPEDKGAYSLEKAASTSEGDLNISYTITARASSSEAAPLRKTASPSSRFDDIDDWETWQAMDDEEEDEEAEDDRDEEEEDDDAGSASQLKRSKSSRNRNARAAKTYTLGGKYIIDEIPSELVVTKVYVGTGEEREELTPLDDYYDKNGRKIVYPIPASASEADPGILTDREGNIIEASLTIDTTINPEILEKWDEGTNLNLRITNKASLRNEENSATNLAAADTTTNKTLGHSLEKDGEEILSQGENKIRWNIKMKTLLHSLYSAYLIDWLGEELEYLDDDEIMATVDGDERKIPFVESEIIFELGKSSPDDYFKNGTFLSEEFENQLAAFEDGTAVKFSYSYETSNGETKHAEGFILPALSLVNKEVELVYYSNVPGTSVNNGHGTVTNNATFFHNHILGDGPGPWDWPPESIDLGQTVDYNREALKKTAGKYEEETQTMTWKFEINRSAAVIDEFTMTDVFDPLKEEILESNFREGKLILKKTDRRSPDESKEIALSQTENENGNYYTLADSDKKKKLTVHLSSISADDYYQFEIKTRMIDPEILSQDNGKIENTAEYELKIDGKTIDGTATDRQGIPNAYVSKAALDSYNYADNLVKWQIGYNPNNILLKNAALTDHLPEGVVFSTDPAYKCELTSVKRKNRPGASVGAGTYKEVSFKEAATASELLRPATLSELAEAEEILRYGLDHSEQFLLAVYSKTGKTAVPDEYTDQALFFVLYEKNDEGTYKPLIGEEAWMFEFTTYVEEEYRQEKFKSAGDTLKLENTVVLDADIISSEQDEGTPVHISKEAAAAHNAAKQVLKESVFHPFNQNEEKYDGLPWLKWELAMNKTSVDFGGVELVDTMADYLELEPDSMEFYKITLKPDGTYEYTEESRLKEEEIENNFDVTKNGGGLTIKYKENAALAKVPLLVVYDTIAVDSLPSGGVVNTVKLNWPNGATDESTSTNTEANNFQSSAFATLKKLQMATVTKKSANSSEGGSGHVLSGAKFKLTPVYSMLHNSPGNPGTWEPVDDPSAAKVRTSNASGQMFFLRLKSDTIYKMEETEAAPGYGLDTYENQYILFSAGGLDELPALPPDIPKTEKEGLHYQNTTTPAGVKMFFDALNAPEKSNNEFYFYKRDEAGNILKGANFTLTANKDGILAEKNVESDEDGKVSFTNLDPGVTYTIKEATPPYGYKKAPGFLTLTVSYDSEKREFVMIAEAKNGFPYTPGSGDNAIEPFVANEPILTNTAFYKTDQNFKPLSGSDFPVKFTVERKEMNAPDETFADYNLSSDGGSSIALGEEGLVKLGQLPCGIYRLTEDFSGVPDGRLVAEQKRQIVLVKGRT